MKATNQILKGKENKMEGDGKDEDLKEFGEMSEEHLTYPGWCYGCVMGTDPLSNVNGMRLDQLVGGGDFPFWRCYYDSYMWVGGKEILSRGGEKETERGRKGMGKLRHQDEVSIYHDQCFVQGTMGDAKPICNLHTEKI